MVFVHDQAAEEKFVADGFGLKRYPVMYNDFVLIGPKGDPVATKGRDIVAALKKISAGNAAFISRGDKSGTHAAELRFWNQAGLADKKGSGYKECGCGMGPALNMAAATGAYVLADRGTWLNFKNRADLAILVEGDKQLFNQYGVMVVNPAKHPHVKQAQGGVARRPERDCQLQDRWRAAVFPERREVSRAPDSMCDGGTARSGGAGTGGLRRPGQDTDGR